MRPKSGWKLPARQSSAARGMPSTTAVRAESSIVKPPASRSARWQHLRLLKKLGLAEEAARDEALLDALDYKVPFADFLIDDTTDPPWGRVRRDDSPPSFGQNVDDDGPNPDDTGSRVPLNPMPPRPGASARISSKNYRRGIKE